jgi:cobyrinic acid a,c-diamide synthase
VVSAQVDVDALINLGKDARPAVTAQTTHQVGESEVRIAIAMDSAFGFYYQDDLDAFKQAGATLIPFSPIQDMRLPKVDGIFLGGGFPERHMEALETNHQMRDSIKLAIEQGMPTYAECGGLMYLSKEIQWHSKHAIGVGVISAKTRMQQRSQGRGYMQLKETGASLWPDGERSNIINAHEFHYSQLEGIPDSTDYAYEVIRGSGITHQKDGIIYKNLLANYAHLRDSEQHHWVSRFVSFVRQHRLKTV